MSYASVALRCSSVLPLRSAGRRRRTPYQRQWLRAVYPVGEGHLALLIEGGLGEDTALDIYTSDGTYLGEIELDYPVDYASTFAIRDMALIAVTKDEFDAKVVIRSSLVP